MKPKITLLALALTVAFTGVAYGQTANSNSGAGASSNVTANPTNVNMGNGASSSSSGSQAGATSSTTGNSASLGVTVHQDFSTPSTQTTTVNGTTTENINVRSSGSTSQSIDTHVSGTQTLKNVPNVIAPNILPTSPCMGSTSIGGSVAGFGIGGGTSWKDGDCGYRETARVFMQAGKMDDGLAVLCASEYAANAPTCKNLKKAEFEQQRVADARKEITRTGNDAGRNATATGTMSKSQYDREITVALVNNDKVAQCDVYRRSGDQYLMSRMGCSTGK